MYMMEYYLTIKNEIRTQVPVTLTCNPSYWWVGGGGGGGGEIVHEILSQKPYHKKGLVEWLKVWALSSSLRAFLCVC
jgi:hypothetical protein